MSNKINVNLKNLKVVDNEIANAKPKIYTIEIIDTEYVADDKTDNVIKKIDKPLGGGRYWYVALSMAYCGMVYHFNICFCLEEGYDGFEKFLRDDFDSKSSIIKNHLIKYIKLVSGFRYEPRYVVSQEGKNNVWTQVDDEDKMDACNPHYLDRIKLMFNRYANYKYKGCNIITESDKNKVVFGNIRTGEERIYIVRRYDENKENGAKYRPKVEPMEASDNESD